MNKLSFSQYNEQNEAIYENLKPEGSNAFASSDKPVTEVESNHNKVSDSKEAGDDFRVRAILQSFIVAIKTEISTEIWL